MKIIVLLLLAVWAVNLSIAEYSRYKARGPPSPPRPPPVPQYVKKWQQPQHPQQHPSSHRNPTRSRPPIPVHMPLGHKIPMGGNHQIPNRPSVPVRNFWKNTQAQFNIPQEQLYIPNQENLYIAKPENPYILKQELTFVSKPEKPYIPKKEKPFLSSPTINNHEIDYHIQTNNIPTHANTIKQVGEKGPIHTIPAPKLGPADKPASSEEITQNVHFPETIVSVQKSHSYQVTEQNEPAYNFYQQNKQPVQQQVQEIEQPNVYYTVDTSIKPQTLALQTQTLETYSHNKNPQSNIFINKQIAQNEYINKDESPQISQKELYQLLNQQLPQETFESFKLPQLSAHSNLPTQHFYQPQLQTQNYQALLSQIPQVYEQENYPRNVEQENDEKEGDVEDEKINIQPELHSFNYEEQSQDRRDFNQDQSSFVTAGYHLDSERGESESVPVTVGRNDVDVVAQAQYVQNYFHTSDNIVENNVEPDAKPSAASATKSVQEELLSSSYYSTLPNKEAAETLAKLQSAGKVNSNLMKIPPKEIIKGKTPITIFVPDDSKDKNETNEPDEENFEQNSRDYEDYSQEDLDVSQDEAQSSFGHRLQPKISEK